MPITDRRPGVLLLAEACNPEWTSVPLLAAYWFRHLRAIADVTLVTQVRNRDALLRLYGDQAPIHFIDTEPIARRTHRLTHRVKRWGVNLDTAVQWPCYLLFEEMIWRRLRREIQGGAFDVIHRLTPLPPVFPSPLAVRSPVPFIIGPLNGSLPWARGTESIRAREGEWLAPLRSAYRSLPGWRRGMEHASLILAAAGHVMRDLPPRLRRKAEVIPENGVDSERFTPPAVPPPSRPFVILFVGRLIALKQPAGIGGQRPAREIYGDLLAAQTGKQQRLSSTLCHD